MEECAIDTVDRISHLPDSIIHHVLSFFPDDPKTLVRVSVLSKNWSSLTASFPILKFDGFHLGKNLFKYVNYTTSRLCEQNVSPHTLDIYAHICEPAERDIIEKCIGLVIPKGVKVLALRIPPYKGKPYRLPSQLLSASSLLSLTISKCELPSSLMVDALKLTSLKLLSLEEVIVDSEVITYLTTSCPLLEDINLDCCYGLKRICVYAHPTLQKVQISSGSVNRIDIEAPNLSYLLVNGDKLEPTCMNLASCEKLQTFCYYGHPSEPFADIFSSFRFIQNLLLCSRRDKWRLSIPSLRSLALHSDCDLDEIDIKAPNLLLFEYSGYETYIQQKWLSAPFKKDDSAHPTALMGNEAFFYVDAIWFEKLRFFLDKYQGIEVLKLHICVNEDGINANELMGIKSPSYELKHLQVAFYDVLDFEDVVDALLWCCRPLSLTLKLQGHFSSWSENQRLHRLKYPYEKLLKQEDPGQTNIRIVLTRHSEAKQHFTDLNSLVEALPHDEYSYTITFIKEKVVEEAGY